jgi:hypothetical protein
MYFKEFPKFFYDFKNPDGSTNTQLVKDITRNVRFRKELLEGITLYDEYDVIDGETPEIIAEKVYGNPKYHWVIMLLNQKWDYINDWVKDETTLVKCIQCTFNPEITATSWSYSGTTITVTAADHGLRASPAITLIVTGTTATTNAPNGTFTSVSPTIIDKDTFSFTVSNAPTGTAGGTMVINTEKREYYIDHYVDDDGIKRDSDYPGINEVTCEQFARDENEKKRRIKLITRDALNTILKDFRDLI